MKELLQSLELYIKKTKPNANDQRELVYKLYLCATTEQLMLFVYMNQNALNLTMLPDMNNNLQFLAHVKNTVNQRLVQ